MNKKIIIKTFATNVAISFFFAAIFILLIYIFGNSKINHYASIINTVAVSEINEKEVASVYKVETKRIINYPSYGKKYGNVVISKINLNLPLYHGDSLSILRYGVGHYAGSYFPGEGGTVILAAHNDVGYFHRLPELEKGDIVKLETNYGTFEYKVDSHKIVKETDLASFPIQKEKDMLIMYTCYPINRSVVGRKTQRYVVYAYLVGDSDE